MTKKDMTEIAQVLANGVVRVYMGATRPIRTLDDLLWLVELE